MKTLLNPLRFSSLVCGLLAVALPTVTFAADPPDADAEKFLVPYEQLLKALVEENLNAAKDAAHALPNGAGDKVQHSKDLKEARNAFADLSITAEKLAGGQPGYHTFYCPMVKKDWVQQSTTVANPYLGKDNADLRGGKESAEAVTSPLNI